MGEPVRQVFIDQWIESYDNYVPDEWGPAFFKDVKPGSMLDQVLLDLMMAWRTTAYIASMPATFIKAIQVSTLAYARYKSSDSSLVSFGEKVLVELSAKIPELVDDRQLRSQLMAELVTLAEDFRQRGEKASAAVDMPIQSLWGDFLKQDAFYMTIWASQRVAYVAFYNAYEAFLVLCAKQALSVDKLRATDPQFLVALRSSFGTDITGPCWGRQEIQIGREVRHALSHAGGRETEKLKKLTHGITITGNVLQITPGDNRKLLQGLKTGVDALVAVAACQPNFTVPAS